MITVEKGSKKFAWPTGRPVRRAVWVKIAICCLVPCTLIRTTRYLLFFFFGPLASCPSRWCKSIGSILTSIAACQQKKRLRSIVENLEQTKYQIFIGSIGRSFAARTSLVVAVVWFRALLYGSIPRRSFCLCLCLRDLHRFWVVTTGFSFYRGRIQELQAFWYVADK